MVRLTVDNLTEREQWQAAGVELPKFDLRQVATNTAKRPEWVHFGAGNIFRGFVANAHQRLLDSGRADTGIVAVKSSDAGASGPTYGPDDNLTLAVLMNAQGDFKMNVVASLVDTIVIGKGRTDERLRLIAMFENPSLRMASFTITEKGYALTGPTGDFVDLVRADMENGPEQPKHTMSLAASLAYRRYLKGQYSIAFVSMDNCSRNGDLLKNALVTIAEEWERRGYTDKGFVAYLRDDAKTAFPLSMIDKITPSPSEKIRAALEERGIEGMDIAVSNNSHRAPFVNAEISEYLVVEDRFPNGRPPLEEAGVIFTDRATVNKVETMKVTTCLNPLHTALAVSGCLLGYTSIADEMRDATLRKFAETIGVAEGLPVVVDPGILDPRQFLREVLDERFANPFIPDTPQRIATDTSQKVGIRFGETLKAYGRSDDLDPASLTAIPLAIALWCRYLLGLDDNGRTFQPSPDPLLETLQKRLACTKLGDTTSNVRAIVADTQIFGVDLYELGLGHKIEGMFYELLEGPGAVRATLDRYMRTNA
ncbi:MULTISPECIES: mannitol dehydrogenase family protein [Saccharibacillus]|uniref:mannitol dehydrogenase family protein n=1 Tax=Saccharibacillus TaxID=456492 RepID=UPI001239AFD8|nr:mannitol dehydrogenase family protein [Saccharibacillus sp. WB 17]MWJ32781.1 mannitol dehydrogenase family protein [Saccharibacillus sp. WB 17]